MVRSQLAKIESFDKLATFVLRSDEREKGLQKRDKKWVLSVRFLKF